MPVSSQRGRVWWLLVLVTVLADLSLVFLLISHPPLRYYIYAAPEDIWQVYSDVMEQPSGYDIIMQHISNGKATPPILVRFCRKPNDDYRPRLQIGMTVVYFAYDDRGDCISIVAKDRRYVILRGENHWPLIPGNCTNLGIGKPIVCKGIPNFNYQRGEYHE